jgi:TPR repeat protein
MTLKISECRWPWNWLYVHINGDVKPCCYATFPVGHISEAKSLKAIWHGDKMEELRRYIVEDKLHPVCAGAGCPYVGSRMPEPSELRPDDIKLSDVPSGILNERDTLFAKMGRKDSLFQLGVALDYHRREEATHWYHEAEKRGSPLAAYKLAYNMRERRDKYSMLDAYRYYRRSALQGYGPAATGASEFWIWLANRVQSKLLPKDDTSWLKPLKKQVARLIVRFCGRKSISYLDQGAAAGDPKAWYKAALLYVDGFLVPRDSAKAKHLLTLAKKRGVAEADDALASLSG